MRAAFVECNEERAQAFSKELYAFERASIFRLEERLIVDGRPAGSIRRKYLHSDVSHADLPGLPAPIQVFAVMVALSGWDLVDALG
ncbi:hypothetical protein AB0C19_01630 [Micromonospora sp. NPDC048842]|uniref:hypothetical protein n=1 Tax=Micromonospora sp. NPDC048842 TaxID=3154346 RepID=UPI0033DDBE48